MKTIRKHKNTNNKGFSLIEVLLAIVILGLVAAPILQMFYTSYRIAGKSKVSLAAADLSQTVMEYISCSSFEDYVSTSDPSLTKMGLKSFYFTTPHPAFAVIPGGPTCSQILLGPGGTSNPVTYKSVKYEKYRFDVTIKYVEPADTSGEYFTYQIVVEVRGSDGVFYNEARTEVVNKF